MFREYGYLVANRDIVHSMSEMLTKIRSVIRLQLRLVSKSKGTYTYCVLFSTENPQKYPLSLTSLHWVELLEIKRTALTCYSFVSVLLSVTKPMFSSLNTQQYSMKLRVRISISHSLALLVSECVADANMILKDFIALAEDEKV